MDARLATSTITAAAGEADGPYDLHMIVAAFVVFLFPLVSVLVYRVSLPGLRVFCAHGLGSSGL